MHQYDFDYDVQPQILSFDIFEMEFFRIIEEDQYWAACSVLFVFLYFIFHLKSFFMATAAIIIILFSFPVVGIIQIGIFGITYY